MKFFEMEEGKTYIHWGVKYRKNRNELEYYSEHNEEWLPSELTPFEIYEMDLQCTTDLHVRKFKELKSNPIICGRSGDVEVKANDMTFESFRNDDGDKYRIFISIDRVCDALTFEEFDEISNYVNELRNLYEEVVK